MNNAETNMAVCR